MYLIYRSWDQGVLGKHVRHLPEPTVLLWVRRMWADVMVAISGLEEERASATAHSLLTDELGASVYGLAHLFLGGGPPPQSMREVRTLAHTRLPDTEQCNADEQSLRVLANGLTYEVAYYLLDDDAAAARPQRWSYPLHQGPLPHTPPPGPVSRPSGASPGFVCPVPPVRLTSQPPSGPGTSYALLLTCRSVHYSVGWDPPYILPGVRIPHLGAALREIAAPAADWPLELRVLRALVAPGENGIGPALQRCTRWPGYSSPQAQDSGFVHIESHEDALRVIESSSPAQAERHVVTVGEHAAQLSIGTGFGDFEQWFLFDDVWAAAQTDLALSLVHYGYHWDPLCQRRHVGWAPCSDNRIRYHATTTPDGQVNVAIAEPEPDQTMVVMPLPAHEDQPAATTSTVEDAVVEILLHQPTPDTFTFGHFSIPRGPGGHARARALARRIRADLRAAGIVTTAGWLPTDRPNGKTFLRTLGTMHPPKLRHGAG